MRFRGADGELDVDRLTAACRLFFIAQEILVDHASYPTTGLRKIAIGSVRSGSAIRIWGV